MLREPDKPRRDGPPMTFRAVKAQLDASIAGYTRLQKVFCPKCTIAYHLFAEAYSTQAEVEAQVESLRKYLSFVCPNHSPDVISTPEV